MIPDILKTRSRIRRDKAAELVEVEARIERARAERAAAQKKAKEDPDVMAHYRTQEKLRQINRLQGADIDARRGENTELNRLKLELTEATCEAYPQISMLAQSLEDQIEGARKQIVTTGSTSTNMFGKKEGTLSSNRDKVVRHIDALKSAIDKINKLVISDSEDIPGELEQIRSAIPIADFTPEEIDARDAVGTAIAGSLANS